MADPYCGEITMFAGNYAPRNWAFCDGQQLLISQNDQLFSLISTTYGGDGRVAFHLPDMRGRVPVHQGRGPGLTNRVLGVKGGCEKVFLKEEQMPEHSHSIQATSKEAVSTDPENRVLGKTQGRFYDERVKGELVEMNSKAVLATGQGTAHDNMAPYCCIHFIIALQGVYPQRWD